LRTSDLSMQEISRLVGYRHQSHFSRAFLRHTGSSPLKFRQQNGERK
jgi:AraC-like DNA-binding protein